MKKLPNLNFRTLLFASVGLASAATVSAVVLYEETWEDQPVGEITAETHAPWVGLNLENVPTNPVQDTLNIKDDGAPDYVSADGGVIPGGNKYLRVFKYNGNTGRLNWNFAGGDTANALPTYNPDGGAVIYLRHVSWPVSYVQAQTPDLPAIETESSVQFSRFNSNWSHKFVQNFKAKDWDPTRTTLETPPAWVLDLEPDKDLPEGSSSAFFPIGSNWPNSTPPLNQPQLAVAKFIYDELGFLVAAELWSNPVFADMDNPDLHVNIAAEKQYDSFLNPLIYLDFSFWHADMAMDSFVIATEWEDVVPQPAAADWAGWPIVADGWVDTGSFMGWINVSFGEFIWSNSLSRYVYLPESHVGENGAWAYIIK